MAHTQKNKKRLHAWWQRPLLAWGVGLVLGVGIGLLSYLINPTMIAWLPFSGMSAVFIGGLTFFVVFLGILLIQWGYSRYVDDHATHPPIRQTTEDQEETDSHQNTPQNPHTPTEQAVLDTDTKDQTTDVEQKTNVHPLKGENTNKPDNITPDFTTEAIKGVQVNVETDQHQEQEPDLSTSQVNTDNTVGDPTLSIQRGDSGLSQSGRGVIQNDLVEDKKDDEEKALKTQVPPLYSGLFTPPPNQDLGTVLSLLCEEYEKQMVIPDYKLSVMGYMFRWDKLAPKLASKLASVEVALDRFRDKVDTLYKEQSLQATAYLAAKAAKAFEQAIRDYKQEKTTTRAVNKLFGALVDFDTCILYALKKNAPVDHVVTELDVAMQGLSHVCCGVLSFEAGMSQLSSMLTGLEGKEWGGNALQQEWNRRYLALRTSQADIFTSNQRIFESVNERIRCMNDKVKNRRRNDREGGGLLCPPPFNSDDGKRILHFVLHQERHFPEFQPFFRAWGNEVLLPVKGLLLKIANAPIVNWQYVCSDEICEKRGWITQNGAAAKNIADNWRAQSRFVSGREANCVFKWIDDYFQQEVKCAYQSLHELYFDSLRLPHMVEYIRHRMKEECKMLGIPYDEDMELDDFVRERECLSEQKQKQKQKQEPDLSISQVDTGGTMRAPTLFPKFQPFFRASGNEVLLPVKGLLLKIANAPIVNWQYAYSDKVCRKRGWVTKKGAAAKNIADNWRAQSDFVFEKKANCVFKWIDDYFQQEVKCAYQSLHELYFDSLRLPHMVEYIRDCMKEECDRLSIPYNEDMKLDDFVKKRECLSEQKQKQKQEPDLSTSPQVNTVNTMRDLTPFIQQGDSGLSQSGQGVMQSDLVEDKKDDEEKALKKRVPRLYSGLFTPPPNQDLDTVLSLLCEEYYEVQMAIPDYELSLMRYMFRWDKLASVEVALDQFKDKVNTLYNDQSLEAAACLAVKAFEQAIRDYKQEKTTTQAVNKLFGALVDFDTCILHARKDNAPVDHVVTELDAAMQGLSHACRVFLSFEAGMSQLSSMLTGLEGKEWGREALQQEWDGLYSALSPNQWIFETVNERIHCMNDKVKKRGRNGREGGGLLRSRPFKSHDSKRILHFVLHQKGHFPEFQPFFRAWGNEVLLPVQALLLQIANAPIVNWQYAYSDKVCKQRGWVAKKGAAAKNIADNWRAKADFVFEKKANCVFEWINDYFQREVGRAYQSPHELYFDSLRLPHMVEYIRCRMKEECSMLGIPYDEDMELDDFVKERERLSPSEIQSGRYRLM